MSESVDPRPERVEVVEIEEEADPLARPAAQQETFVVAAGELWGAVQKLVYEANVRRVMVKRGDRVLLDIPLLVGIGGIALAPPYAALAIIGALAADYSIVVERMAPPADEGPESV